MMLFSDESAKAFGAASRAFPGDAYELVRGDWVEGAGIYTDREGTRWFASWDTRNGITYLERAPEERLTWPVLLGWSAIGLTIWLVGYYVGYYVVREALR